MKKILAAAGVAVLSAAPMVASADIGEAITNLKSIIKQFGSIVQILIPIVFALALLAFFWGMVRFIFAGGDEGAKENGKNLMIGGTIALFVMSAIWGIIRLIGNTLGVSTSDTTQTPPNVTIPGI